MVKLPTCAYLQDDVDVETVVKAPVHLDDVGVIEEHLNFHLSDKLVSNLLLVQ